MPDGRPWRHVRVSETTRIASGNIAQSAFFLRVASRARTQHLKCDPTLEEVISDREADAIWTEVLREMANPAINTGDGGVLLAPDGRVSVVTTA
jgi:hypothetical protein